MQRDLAIRMAQDAIKANNKQPVEAVLTIKAERNDPVKPALPLTELPLIGVTCATGWECYAIAEELAKTRKFRVRAMYRSTGTQAEKRLLH